MQLHNPSYACLELSLTVVLADHRDTGPQGKIPQFRQLLSGIRKAYMQMCVYMKIYVCIKSFKGLVLESFALFKFFVTIKQFP